MFRKATNLSVALVQKLLPDAFIFAIVLTILSFVFSMLITGQGVVALTNYWGKGVFSLLSFTMQMALVLTLGAAFASSKPIRNSLKYIASFANSSGQAIILVTLVSSVASWINWGFGLIVGALFAKELVKTVKGIDYRLLIASAYSGFLVWHGGFSGSVPLTVASNPERLLKTTQGALADVIPVSQTIFSMPNLIVLIILIVTLPFLNRAMHPHAQDVVEVAPETIAEPQEEKSVGQTTLAQKLENCKALSLAVVVLAIFYLAMYFSQNGFKLNLNIVNLIFLSLGILFHGTPISYVRAIEKAIKGAAGIVLQFPFYAGIMGIVVGANAAGESLASVTTNAFLSISNAQTFPLFTFLSAGLVNIFVPSGGGQWVVQAPVMMPASMALGVDPAVTAMAIAWGDAWTNMIQPFWALPALGLAGLGAKDIMGYSLMVLVYSGVVLGLSFLFLF